MNDTVETGKGRVEASDQMAKRHLEFGAFGFREKTGGNGSDKVVQVPHVSGLPRRQGMKDEIALLSNQADAIFPGGCRRFGLNGQRRQLFLDVPVPGNYPAGPPYHDHQQACDPETNSSPDDFNYQPPVHSSSHYIPIVAHGSR